jgi:hypothetical protein
MGLYRPGILAQCGLKLDFELPLLQEFNYLFEIRGMN